MESNTYPVSAAAAVLGTAELLESILLTSTHQKILDPRDVSRQWRDIIKHSPKLQKRMFLRPATLQHVIGLKISNIEVGYPVIWYNSRMCEVRKPEDEGGLPSIAVLNPAFFDLKAPSNPRVSMKKLLWAKDEKSAHMRDMLITQPPAKRILFVVCLGEKRGQGMRDDTEVKMGEVREIMAGGGSGSKLKSLLERMTGVEEQVMEYWGHAVDWRQSEIVLKGQAFSGRCLERWFR